MSRLNKVGGLHSEERCLLAVRKSKYLQILGGVVLTLSRGIDDAANTHNHSWELSTSSHLIISVLMMNPDISGGTYAYRRRASL